MVVHSQRSIGTSPEMSIEQQMALALAGNKAAYDHVLRKISHYLAGFLSRKMPPKDRDDACRKSCCPFIKRGYTYDPARPLMPWVMAIARYRIHDYWRHHYGHTFHESVDIEDMKNILSVDETKAMETREDITRILRSLPPRQREVLDLMYRQDKSVQEVATALKMSVSAVKVTAHRGYKVFRKHLMD